MAERDHDAAARRLLSREGFGQHLDYAEGVSIDVSEEKTEFILAEVIAFLLGERVPEKNIFKEHLPSEAGDDADVVALKTEGEDRYFLFTEDADAPDSLSIELRDLGHTAGESGVQDVFSGDLIFLVILDKPQIARVEFEVITEKDSGFAMRSVLIESEGGYFVRISDNGTIQSWNAFWEDDTDEAAEES